MVPPDQLPDVPRVEVSEGDEVTFHLPFHPSEVTLSLRHLDDHVSLPAGRQVSWTVPGFGFVVLTAWRSQGGDASYVLELVGPPADDTGQANGGPDLTRVLNEDLVSFLHQAGFTPLGGDHDYMNASDIVETEGGATVSVFVYPRELADVGDVSFEQNGTTEVDGTTVALGHRSDGQAAARFDCGDYQFQFFGGDEPAVNEVAVSIAAEVPCPYTPDTP